MGNKSDEPLLQGVASSVEAAYEDAERAVGPVQQGANWHAKVARNKELALKRKATPTDSRHATSVEFVYDCHPSFSQDGGSVDDIIKYQIVRKTKKRIYVDYRPYREPPMPCSGERHNYETRTFVLDRKELEETGKASSRRRSYATFYSDPSLYFAERRVDTWPECLQRLGVSADATADDIKAAYRTLAKHTHPDRGGDTKHFVAIKKSFDEAMKYVGGQ